MLDVLAVDTPSAGESSADQQDAYEELMAFLTSKQREAVEARLSGLSYSRCAELLGVSIRSVRTRHERAMAEFRRQALLNPGLFERLAGTELGVK